jgi:sugar-specific transcriptional regulator TrmB
MDIKIALKEYGLTDKEINVFLSLLSLGAVKIQEIQKRIGLPRTTVYNTLNYLMEKGLVSKIISKGVSLYSTTEPERLKDVLEEKKKLIESIIPELNSMKSLIKESSKIEMYEGFKGIYTILSDVFKIKQEVCYFGGYHNSLAILQHLPEHARLLRLERHIHARIVIEQSEEEIFHTKKYKDITQMRFLDSMKDFPCMMFVYGNKIAMYTLEGDLIGSIIKNQQIAQAMKMIFDMYWKQAKPSKL